MSDIRPIIYKYPLDLTGTNPNNLVISEPHTLGEGLVRAIVPNYGAFFTESLVVRDADTGITLIPHDQFKAAQLYQEATEKTGKEVCSIIVITDSSVSSNIEITLQVIGGEFSTSVYALREMLDGIDLDNHPVEWASIIGTPSAYPPAPHLHDAGDLYGFEYLVEAISALRSAILIGDEMAHNEIMNYINSIDEALTLSFSSALNTHIGSGDHDEIYVNKLGDQMTGPLDISSKLTFENYKHGISYNDGSGNFNIKVATTMDNTNMCTEEGFGTHLKYTQSTGTWDFRISNESRLVGQLYTWLTPLSFSKNKVTVTGELVAPIVTGNASTATKLLNSRNIAISGDATWNVNFDGSSNVTSNLTLANSGVTSGNYGSSIQVPIISIDSKGRITRALNIAIRSATTTQSGVVTTTTQSLTGHKTFLNSTGTRFVGGSTQDAIQIMGRNGGVSSRQVTLIPTTLTASRTLTLPDASGTIALTSQIPVVPALGKNYQLFTSSGWFYKPAGVTKFRITAIGGGGGGGRSSYWGRHGDGGGGGGTAVTYVNLTNSSYYCVVGSGGAGGGTVTIGASAGSTSYISNVVSAGGGRGGCGDNYTNGVCHLLTCTDTSNGGIGTLGTANMLHTGENGECGYYREVSSGYSGTYTVHYGGRGGNSESAGTPLLRGYGGAGGIHDSGQTNGTHGKLFGGGGGGAGGVGVGGNGANGCIMIEW